MLMMLTFASSLHQLANHLNAFASRGGTVICTSHVYQRHFAVTTGINSLLAPYFDESHAVKITPDKHKVFYILLLLNQLLSIVVVLSAAPKTLPIKTDIMH